MDFRDLPAVDDLAHQLELDAVAAGIPVTLITGVARSALEEARAQIAGGGTPDPRAAALGRLARLAASRPRNVINATGVLLHTNLGRAPISASAAASAAEAATGYGNIEFDLTDGSRGGRGAYVRELLTSLTGAGSALVVNNNAGALLLCLAAIAAGRSAVVSRGELIEIGGSFRLPDVMRASGAHLAEVGTTNRTRVDDYRRHLEGAAMVLKVHPSNYRIEGFAEDVGYAALADLAGTAGVPFVADVGSGLLDVRVPWLEGLPPAWLADEPGVRQTLEAGADLVLFSGDKLLGGPQAGIVVGRADLVAAMAGHPMARALRCDGATLASLAATLELYATGNGSAIPFWKMATLGYEELQARHHRVLSGADVGGAVVAGVSLPGAGSVPGQTIPSPNIQLAGSADQMWKVLIAGDPPIIGRRQDGALRLDLRTVADSDDEVVTAALRTLR